MKGAAGKIYLFLFFLLIPGILINQSCVQEPSVTEGGGEMDIILTSSAFKEGEIIPARYACDGENLSPPLNWSEPPESTGAFTLTLDDPDAPAGNFNHWVIYNIPATARQLQEGMSAKEKFNDGTLQGHNGAAQTGYFGPCPPFGVHHYVFTLYALDAPLTLQPGAARKQVLEAMNNHILAKGKLTGIYQRQKR